jgi:hypothetical protein
MSRILNCAAGWILYGAALLGSDFSGTWIGQIPGRNNTFQDVAFKLMQDGGALTGKLYGDYGSTAIREAVISGDLITFIVITSEQAGNQINQTRLRFTGRMIDGQIELTRERERSTDAVNGGVAQYRNNNTQTFRLKRLL